MNIEDVTIDGIFESADKNGFKIELNVGFLDKARAECCPATALAIGNIDKLTQDIGMDSQTIADFTGLPFEFVYGIADGFDDWADNARRRTKLTDREAYDNGVRLGKKCRERVIGARPR